MIVIILYLILFLYYFNIIIIYLVVLVFILLVLLLLVAVVVFHSVDQSKVSRVYSQIIVLSDRCSCCAAVPPSAPTLKLQKERKSFWFKHTEQFLFPFIYSDDSLQPKHHHFRLPASFNAALVIQVHSNTAGGVGVFLRGDLSPARFADKPGHVTGERPGSDLDTGLVDV